MFTIIAVILGVVFILGVAYKAGYSAAKKNFLIHIFKERMITPEQYKEFDEMDI